MEKVDSIKRLKPQYFKVCNPTYVKYFGIVPASLGLLSLYLFLEFSTFLNVLGVMLAVVGVLVVFIILIDFIDLLSNARIPEISDKTFYALNDEKTAFIYRILKGGKDVAQKMERNICKYEFDRLSKTLWVSKNIVFNFFLNVFCRLSYLAFYYICTKIGIKNERYIHPKAIYYHLINTSLSYYIKGDSPQVEFNEFFIVGSNRNSWQCETRFIHKAILHVDHDTETTIKLEVFNTKKDLDSNKPDTLTDQYEIYAFLLLFNKFIAHTNVHTSAPFICDIDEKFLPKRVQAEQAINSVNNLVIKWEVIFIGKAWFYIVQHGTNSGRPHNDGPQPILEKKSQFYNALMALRKDKVIQGMINESIKTLNTRRRNQKLEPYSELDLAKRKQNLQLAIENSVLGHCCDHWVHDNFLSPLINSEYLQFSDVVGTIMGTRWTDDIVTNLRSHDQPLANAVYKILEREAPDIVQGFHWTVFQ